MESRIIGPRKPAIWEDPGSARPHQLAEQQPFCHVWPRRESVPIDLQVFKDHYRAETSSIGGISRLSLKEDELSLD